MFKTYKEDLMRELRMDAISGFLAIAPFALIVFLTGVVFRVSYSWVGVLADGLISLIVPDALQRGPLAPGYTHWLSVLLLLMLLVTLGMFVRRAIGKISLQLVEKVLSKTPILGPLYSFSRKLTDAFGNVSMKFQRVVSVPAEGGKRELAFVTGSIEDTESGRVWVSLFVPMGVTGTGKQYIMPADGDIVDTNIDTEAAIQWYGTFGVVGLNGVRFNQK